MGVQVTRARGRLTVTYGGMEAASSAAADLRALALKGSRGAEMGKPS